MKCRPVDNKLFPIVISVIVIFVLFAFPGHDPVVALDSMAAIRIGGTGGAMGAMNELAEAFQKKHPGIAVKIIPHLGTRGGIRAVLAGAIDIGLAGRYLNPQEQAQGLQEYEYARSPFVFVTNRTGSMMDLTPDTIAKIYRGEIRKWPDGTPLRLVLRPGGDVDTIMLKAISAEMQDAVNIAGSRAGMMMAQDDQENCDMLERIQGAFGTSTFTQVVSEKRSLTALSYTGVRPDIKARSSGNYPYYKPFLMVTGPKTLPVSRKFIEFVTSPEGMRILRRTGNTVPKTN